MSLSLSAHLWFTAGLRGTAIFASSRPVLNPKLQWQTSSRHQLPGIHGLRNSVLVLISSYFGPRPYLVLVPPLSLSFNIFLLLVRSSSRLNLQNSFSSSLVPGKNWDEDRSGTTPLVPRTPG